MGFEESIPVMALQEVIEAMDLGESISVMALQEGIEIIGLGKLILVMALQEGIELMDLEQSIINHQLKKETGKMFSLIATIGTTAAIEWFTGGVLFGISAYSVAKETTK